MPSGHPVPSGRRRSAKQAQALWATVKVAATVKVEAAVKVVEWLAQRPVLARPTAP